MDEKAAIERAREASRQKGRDLEDYDEPSADFVGGEWQVRSRERFEHLVITSLRLSMMTPATSLSSPGIEPTTRRP